MSLEYASSSASSKQKNHHQLSSDFIQWLKSTVGGEKEIKITNTFSPKGFSNNIVRLTFDDGRKMVIKQSKYGWAKPRFESARNASQLIRRQSSIAAPKHIAVPNEVVEYPTIAYWYLPYPTLKELWLQLSPSQRKQASKSLGRMLRKVHQITVGEYGLLRKEHSYQSASAFMYSDLHDRLKPSIAAYWPDVLPMVDRLIQIAKNLPDNEHNAALVHNDMHLGNIICKIRNDKIKCIGLLDLEEASGGIWESDLASAMTLHHPLFFSSKLKGSWFKDFGQYISEGYGKEPDQKLLRFFRIYHLVNLGYFSAMNEEFQHARHIGKKASELLNTVA